LTTADLDEHLGSRDSEFLDVVFPDYWFADSWLRECGACGSVGCVGGYGGVSIGGRTKSPIPIPDGKCKFRQPMIFLWPGDNAKAVIRRGKGVEIRT
jgi:hypothetical protein